MATVFNSGNPNKDSNWGVENIEEYVIDVRPDLVFIEFSINDADLQRNISVAQSRINLNTMIDRIMEYDSQCKIILMVMNPPAASYAATRPHYKDYRKMYNDVARERNLEIIDHSRNWDKIQKEDMVLFNWYVPDGIHPTSEACEVVVLPEILRSLGIERE